MGNSSSPAPDEYFEFKNLEFKISQDQMLHWRNLSAHLDEWQLASENERAIQQFFKSAKIDVPAVGDMSKLQENMRTIQAFVENARPDLSAWNRYKVPDSLINHDFLRMQYEVIVPPALTKYMEHERDIITQLKALSQKYPKPSETVAKAIEHNSKLFDAVSKANQMWGDIERPVVIDGLFTVANIMVPQINLRSEIADWAQRYTGMYMRIATELRRERETLEAMFEAIKANPVITEYERLMMEFQIVCELSEGVHLRLCQIETVTCRRQKCTELVVDEAVAALRIDHGRMDDALGMIGEIPTELLTGQTPFVARTWFRLRGIAKRLRLIDRDIEGLFQVMLDS